jgi:hybrid cluster-associated redox disulfide protein
MKNDEINKETGIGALIEENPEMNDVLYEYGLYCGNCFAAGFDTLEEGAKSHGLEDEEIEELIQELNKKMKNKKLEKTEIK